MAALNKMLGHRAAEQMPDIRPRAHRAPRAVVVVKPPYGPWPKTTNLSDGSRCLAFLVPDRPPTANQKPHWGDRGESVATWRGATRLMASRCGKGLPASFVTVLVPSGVRDPANLGPCAKAMIDGLVDAGWWTDDCDEIVHQMQPVALPPKGLVCAVVATPFDAGIASAQAAATSCRKWLVAFPGGGSGR